MELVENFDIKQIEKNVQDDLKNKDISTIVLVRETVIKTAFSTPRTNSSLTFPVQMERGAGRGGRISQ